MMALSRANLSRPSSGCSQIQNFIYLFVIHICPTGSVQQLPPRVAAPRNKTKSDAYLREMLVACHNIADSQLAHDNHRGRVAERNLRLILESPSTLPWKEKVRLVPTG